MNHKLAVFKGKNVRRIIHNNEWWFVVTDIIAVLTDTTNPSDYVKKMRIRDKELSKGWGQIVTPLSIQTSGGKQKLNCANTQSIFRIIQSIPSPKAEAFKRWLAKVGYERIQEIEDPELGTKRTRAVYKAKGYSNDWIEKRMRGIAIREELTDEWEDRGIQEQQDFAILTSEIHEATFGLKPGEHKSLKNLKRENLRDHMTDLELIFSMLGEASTTNLTRGRNAQGLNEIKKAAQDGGRVAGNARKELELQGGEKVVTEHNYLSEAKKLKKDISDEGAVIDTPP